MEKTRVPIGRARRDISEMINRVAYGKERIILTSRGKPKAALVSMDDYQTLQSLQSSDQARLNTWMQETKALAEEIIESRNGEPVDVDSILTESRNDLEGRDARFADRG